MLAALDRPGVNLLRYFAGADYVLLLDAVIDNDLPVGEGRHYLIDDIRTTQLLHSSHGFGVPQALDLAMALGELPSRIELLGVSIGAYEVQNPINWEKTVSTLATSLETEIASICGAFMNQNVTN